MITLNEIAYNIKNLAYGGLTSTENNISLRQIKHWIHYHRAKLIADNIDKGILNNQSLTQSVDLILRNSTTAQARDYYKAWDDFNRDSSLSAPAITAGFIENHPRYSSGEFTDEFLAYSSIAFSGIGDPTKQRYLDTWRRDFYGRETQRSQIRGDFRNYGFHAFWIPKPLMLKDNNGIKGVTVQRVVHRSDEVDTSDINEEVEGYNKKFITIPHQSVHDREFGIYNKFSNELTPSYWQARARDQREENTGRTYLVLNNLQVSPNYHGGLNAPGDKKIFWKYRGTIESILENPTDIKQVYARKHYVLGGTWDDAINPYPIPMEYVSDLIQRVIQVEMQAELKTMPDIITDGMDDLMKLKIKGGTQVQR